MVGQSPTQLNQVQQGPQRTMNLLRKESHTQVGGKREEKRTDGADALLRQPQAPRFLRHLIGRLIGGLCEI